MKIVEIPKENRPREKAYRFGISSLSDDELVAVIIGSGVKGCSALDISRNLLTTYGTLQSLQLSNFSSLEEHFGLSKTLALRLLAVFEFHSRLISPMYQKQKSVENASELYLQYRYLENYEQETVVLLMLNKRRVILKEKQLYRGTNESVLVNPKEIIAELIVTKCSSFVLIHNHTNQNGESSAEDLYMTEMLKTECEKFGIAMFDHIIIYQGGYYSFSEHIKDFN